MLIGDAWRKGMHADARMMCVCVCACVCACVESAAAAAAAVQLVMFLIVYLCYADLGVSVPRGACVITHVSCCYCCCCCCCNWGLKSPVLRSL